MADLIERQTWQQFAACRDLNDDTMTPDDDPHRIGTAKLVCAGCSVVAECLAYAMETLEPWGVWGGLTHIERERVRAGRPARPCAGCRTQFVPRLQTQVRCGRCAADDPNGKKPVGGGCGKGKLTQYQADITAWASQGRTDRWIAATLQTSVTSVKHARDRWGIAPGIKSRKMLRVDDEFRPHILQEVIDGRSPFRILTLPERLELWRRHAAVGGNMLAFERRHRQSHTTVKGLRDECARLDRNQVPA